MAKRIICSISALRNVQTITVNFCSLLSAILRQPLTGAKNRPFCLACLQQASSRLPCLAKNILEKILTVIIFPFLIILFPVSVSADMGSIYLDGERTYKAVQLTPEVYNKSNEDLSDILIYDEDKNTVPYFINSVESVNIEQAETVYPLAFADSFVKDGDTYEDYYAESSEQKDILATSISVQAQASVFAKTIELRGGYDGINWEFVQSDILYRVDENEKLKITFERPLKYTYYRFKILDNAEGVAFDGVSLEYDYITAEQAYFNEVLTPAFNVEEIDDKTVISVYGMKNLKINKIELETGGQFKRPVDFAVGRSKMLYNLSFEDAVYQDTILPFDDYRERKDVLEIRIHNGDDAPIEVNDIIVTYYAEEIVFKGQNHGEYTISFGDESILQTPEYDIVNYKELILKEGYDVLDIKNIKAAEIEQEPEKPDYSMAFNIVIVIISILLGFIILVRLKRPN